MTSWSLRCLWIAGEVLLSKPNRISPSSWIASMPWLKTIEDQDQWVGDETQNHFEILKIFKSYVDVISIIIVNYNDTCSSQECICHRLQ